VPATRRFACGTGIGLSDGSNWWDAANRGRGTSFGGERRAPPGDGRPEEAEDAGATQTKGLRELAGSRASARSRKRFDDWRPFASCKPEQETPVTVNAVQASSSVATNSPQGVASREQAPGPRCLPEAADHSAPTPGSSRPIDDMNFIAQLAQFSSLEKLTEIADGVQALGAQIRGSQTIAASTDIQHHHRRDALMAVVHSLQASRAQRARDLPQRHRNKPREPQHRGVQGEHVNFSDLVSHTVAAPATTRCRWGSAWPPDRLVAGVQPGHAQNTQEPTNAAIQGNGLFVVRTGDSVVYTRMAASASNANGVLVTADGCPSRVDADGSHDRRDPDNGQGRRHRGAARCAARAVGDDPVRDV